MTEPSNAGQHAIREHFEAHGQGHVFRFWDELDAEARERLASQAAGFDLPSLLAALERLGSGASKTPGDIEPVEVETLADAAGSRGAKARRRGEEMLAAGRVGVMVVAGGQGSRLGFSGPKGDFPIGPISSRTLFGIQAEKIRGVRRRCGRPVPWYIMTSDATDASTRALFDHANCFGLPREDIVFFRQGMVPSFDFGQRLILERRDRIFENPDGHGGSLTALVDSGTLDDMERRGIDTLFYYQVDNAIVRMADPLYLGFHDLAGAEMSCKVVRKRSPDEPVGIVVRSAGRTACVEYTELDEDHANALEADGSLRYWTGNTAIHVFSTAFIRRVAADAEQWLPFHASAKKIATIDERGRELKPTEPNGYKLERFVFDAVPVARNVCVVEARRSDEYSPVKNAEGSDSPETARSDLVNQVRSWLEAAKIEIPPTASSIEVDHSRIDGPDDALALGIRRISEAGDAIRITSGVSA